MIGKKIYDPKYLDKIKNNKEIKLILFAIPSLNKVKKKEVVQKILNLGIEIKTLPNLGDIIEDKLSFSDVKDYLIEDLLDRDPVELITITCSKYKLSNNFNYRCGWYDWRNYQDKY